MAAALQSRRRFRRGRIVLGILLALVLAAVVAAVLLYLQIPQRALLQRLARQQLGAEVRVEGLHLWGTPRADSVQMIGPASTVPLVVLEDVTVEYAWFPENGRYIKSINIGALKLSIEGTRESGNFAFLYDAISKGGSGSGSSSFVPEGILVREISVDVDRPEWQLEAGPITASARLDSAQSFGIVLSAAAMDAAWRTYALGTQGDFRDGNLEISALIASGGYKVDAAINLGDLASGAFHVDLRNAPLAGMVFDVAADDFTLGSLFGEIISDFTGAEMHFDSLRIRDTNASGRWSPLDFHITDSQLVAEAAGLVLGPPETPWYAGGLTIEGSGSGQSAGGANVTGTLRLDDGQLLELQASGGAASAEGKIRFNEWNRTAIRALLPDPFGRWLEFVSGMQSLTGDVSVHWSRPNYTVEASLTPILRGGQSANVTADAHGVASDGLLPLEFGAVVESGGATASTTWTLAEDGRSGAVLFNYTPLHEWLDAWLGKDYLSDTAIALTGTLEINAPAGAAPTLTANLTAPQLRLGSISLDDPPLRLEGNASLLSSEGKLAGNTLQVRLDDGTSVTLDDWELTLSPFVLKGVSHGSIDLAWVARVLEKPLLSGTSEFGGPLAIGAESIAGTVNARFSDLMYGDVQLPYGQTLSVQGEITYGLKNKALLSPHLEIDLTPDTKASIDGVTAGIDDTGLAFALDTLALRSDMQPLVARGYLDSVNGVGNLKGTRVRYAGGKMSGDFAVTAEAQVLVLPKYVARLETVGLDADFHYDDGLEGSGALTVGALVVAGAKLDNISTTLTADQRAIVLHEIRTGLYGGEVEATAVLGVLQERFPTNLRATLRNVDLAQFTTEFKPPDVRLTGLASGTGGVDFDLDGLNYLQIELESKENFSINRDVVEKMLMRQYVGEMSGGKELDRVVAGVVGEADQRRFDRAYADLALSETTGRITGPLILESKLLDLTVDVLADPGAILEAIQIRQRPK